MSQNSASEEGAFQKESLLSFVESVAPDAQLRVEERFEGGFVRLRVHEAELRQAQHDIRCIEDALIELLRNARDAGARTIYVATTREGDLRSLTVLDDGAGIPASMHERIFDARVTSKLDSAHIDRWGVHGRGMALFSIAQNSSEAYVCSSAPSLGTALRVVSNAQVLDERSDQSSWPKVQRTSEEGESYSLRGPHNLYRCCTEFALEERGQLTVYIGSPAEVLATLRQTSQSGSQDFETVPRSFDDLPVLERAGAAQDARSLLEVAQELGLELSERTAHRIMAGSISPLESVYAKYEAEIAPRVHAQAQGNLDLLRDARGLKIAQADLEDFTSRLASDFELLSSSYYLTLNATPKVSLSGNKLTVTFEFDKMD